MNKKEEEMETRESTERLARIEAQMESVLARLTELVSRAEFLPVKVITFGLVGGIMTAFLTALIVKVIS